ncbi:unnamed protein product [Vitrella brassicaformis CCMP3155]|uniref:AAA+ ATPase domain-containing protein n=1 Tax=Vitrella brassicaformis (strain CCMP3155) TaxID=1169540 RepID=A0A0G4F9E4_VITBC|nr:unnamed protein product [Vitrella brassicaformis CCMP3155]|eukprot:CEM09276.1 unnamed protein product [Vitrella brassicaformis CCMP3155]
MLSVSWLVPLTYALLSPAMTVFAIRRRSPPSDKGSLASDLFPLLHRIRGGSRKHTLKRRRGRVSIRGGDLSALEAKDGREWRVRRWWVDGDDQATTDEAAQDDRTTQADDMDMDMCGDSGCSVSEDVFASLGGCQAALSELRQVVEVPLLRPELYEGLPEPSRGVILHGPHGCGKRSMVKALANGTGANLITISAAKLEVAESESTPVSQYLDNVLRAAEKSSSPSIVLMEDLDMLAPQSPGSKGGVGIHGRSITEHLCRFFEELATRRVIVMGTTSNIEHIDPALRRLGRFEAEVEMGMPDKDGRREILAVLTRGLRLAPDVKLDSIAERTHGYVGADLALLCKMAGKLCIRDHLARTEGHQRAPRQSRVRGHSDDSLRNQISYNGLPCVKSAVAEHGLTVSHDHFEQALTVVKPSCLQDAQYTIETPSVSWCDIGGLDAVKDELKEAIDLPLNHPELVSKFNLQASRGVLLHGPPGCGKTLLAKAVARESGANFLSVKGPELLSKWFGQSEANVRELFKIARASAPAVIFFDEIDALGRRRGSTSSGEGSEASARVLNQLLTELDGLGSDSGKHVVVIAATNRPDVLDEALLRPGRFDRIVLIPLPDEGARRSCLEACLRKTPVETNVDLDRLAQQMEGFSGADINELCQRAARLAVRENIEASSKRPIDVSQRHFDEALKTARRSVSPEVAASYRRHEQDNGPSSQSPPPSSDRDALERPVRITA